MNAVTPKTCQPVMADQEKMTIEEVAAFLECTVETVEIGARTRRLAAVKHGRSWIFLRSALIEGLRQEALGNLEKTRAAAPVRPALPAQIKGVKATNRGSRTRPRPALQSVKSAQIDAQKLSN